MIFNQKLKYQSSASAEAVFFAITVNKRAGMYYTEKTIIYYDGEFVKAAEAKTDLYGQSLHYGYAVFEGIRAYSVEEGTRIFKAKEHFDRLIQSARLMKMPFNYTTGQLIELSYEVLKKNDFADAYLRPLVISSPNMSLSKGKRSHLAIEAWEWTNGYLSDNMRVMTSTYRRPNPDGFHIEAKVSGHYVNSILACQEAKDNHYDEALLLDGDGYIAEGPGANVFFENDGILFTPEKGNILPGITRSTILELCMELNIPVREGRYKVNEMRGTDAAFFCGTAAEIVALESLDDVPFRMKWSETVGARLQQEYRKMVREKSLHGVRS